MAAEGQQFGSLLRGESLLKHSGGVPWCALRYGLIRLGGKRFPLPTFCSDAVDIYLRS